MREGFSVISARYRIGIGSLVTAVAVSGFGVQAINSPVTAATPVKAEPDAGQSGPSTRPDKVSAMVTAQATGERVEDLSQGDESTRVFANPDGSWTSDTTAGPQRARDENGEWAEVDTTLIKSGGRLVPKNVPIDLSISAGGDKVFADAVPVEGAAKDELAWRWPTELPEPTLDGSTATYADAVPGGGDLVVTATPSGFTHNIVLHEPPAGLEPGGTVDPADGPVFELPVVTPGAKLTESADGSLKVVDQTGTGTGDQVASAPAPLMWDSSQDPVTGDPAVEPVAVSVEQSKASNGTPIGTVALSPAAEFLSDPDTVYPVTIDPTFQLLAGVDTWVSTNYPSSQSGSTILRVGTKDGVNKARAYMTFAGDSVWDGNEIVTASLILRNVNSGSCTAGAVRASRITSAWSASTVTMTSPSASTPVVDYSPAHGFGAACPNNEATWDVTPLVTSWASSSGYPNYGIRLAAASETNPNTFREYRSLEYGIDRPRIVTTYNRYPATPTALNALPGTGTLVSSKTPTLSAVLSDPDGGQVSGFFEIKQGTTLIWSGTSAAVPSGGKATIAVPAGKLLEGQTYTIKVSGKDPRGMLTKTPATKTVTVDTITPTVQVTSANFTNAAWAGTVPSSDTLTFDGSSADVSGFYVSYRGATAPVAANSSGDATLPWTPTAGWHEVSVTAVDKAGNQGPVTLFAFGVGDPVFTTPGQWAPSTSSYPLEVSAPPGSSGASLQWRRLGATSWAESSQLKNASGDDWTGTVITSGGRSTTGDLVWNATEEPEGTTTLAGPAVIESRACFTYPSAPTKCTTSLVLTLFASAFGDRFPVTDLGPAKVALFNGEAILNTTDAADSAAGFGRTFSTFSDDTLTSSTASLFGPAWSDPDVLAPSEDAEAEIIDNRGSDGTFVIIDAGDGSEVFTPDTTSGAPAGRYKPLQATSDATALTFTAGSGGAPDRLTLARPLGTATVETTWEFKNSDTATDPDGESEWVLAEADGAGEDSDIDVTSEGQRPVFIRESDTAAAATCTKDIQTEGCRALKVSYAGLGAAMRVSKVERIVGAAGGLGIAKTLATYTYDGGGDTDAGRKLAQVCAPDPDGAGADPALCAEYTYTTAAGRTLIATIKPAGQTQWRFGYDAVARLKTVKRERPAAAGGGDAVWSIDYSLTPASAGLPDMSAAKVAEWGQTLAPHRVFGVYGPGADGSGTPDIGQADLFYTDTAGNLTNTASAGPDGWLVDTTWYDSRGNETQHLGASGWARVQAAPAAERLRIATEASSFTTYNAWGNDATVGTRVTDEFGPAVSATLSDGTLGYFRSHTATMYDDDPNVDPDLVANRPASATANGAAGLGLVVKQTSSVATVDRTTDVGGAGDRTVAKIGYGPIVTGDADGWVLGNPTSTSTKSNDTDWSTSISRYNAAGQLVETRQPGGGTDSSGAGNDAHSTVTSYYTIDGTGDCGNKRDWAGLVCKTGPAGADTLIPTTHFETYDIELKPSVVKEISGGDLLRTTTTVFDAVGRTSVLTVATSGEDVVADSITTTFGYGPTTGLPATVTTSGPSGGTVTTGYDAWGRSNSYIDSTGNAASTTYDAAGRIGSQSTGANTTDYAYDGNGFITSASVDQGIGSFGYDYNTDGSAKSVDYPNGIRLDYSTDDSGAQTGMSYSTTGAGATTLLAFTTAVDVNGRTVGQTSSASEQHFGYDRLGRLTKVEDIRNGACVTRTYGFSPSSERTSFKSHDSATDGSCQTATAAATAVSSYDAANRIANVGYNYDSLGRTLTVPAADTASGGATPLAASYRANDMVASLSQDVTTAGGGTESRSTTYSLDPSGRPGTITNETGGTETTRLRYRYGSSSDSPVSVQTSTNSGVNWTATNYAVVPGLGLAAQTDNATGTFVATYSLTNPHGDTVATVNSSAAVQSYAETDEYGNALTASTARYGWLGMHQRSTDAIGGVVLMGARLYNPRMGTFLSNDPINGGNATRYGYPLDPVNQSDLSGACLALCPFIPFIPQIAAGVVTAIGWVILGGVLVVGGVAITMAATKSYAGYTVPFPGKGTSKKGNGYGVYVIKYKSSSGRWKVWKYGMTGQPGQARPGSQLFTCQVDTGSSVRCKAWWKVQNVSKWMAKALESQLIWNYLRQHGKCPPGHNPGRLMRCT